MAIYSGFSHWKWWFFIVMLVYQMVTGVSVTGLVFFVEKIDTGNPWVWPWNLMGLSGVNFPIIQFYEHFSWVNHHFSWVNHHFSWVNHHFSWVNHHFSWVNHHFSWVNHHFSWVNHHFNGKIIQFDVSGVETTVLEAGLSLCSRPPTEPARWCHRSLQTRQSLGGGEVTWHGTTISPPKWQTQFIPFTGFFLQKNDTKMNGTPSTKTQSNAI